MLRIVLVYILPLLAPTLVFLTWVWLRGRYVATHGGKAPAIEDGPWFWLIFSGGILVLITMGAMALFFGERGAPGDTYVPPHVIDGRVVPGHHEQRPER